MCNLPPITLQPLQLPGSCSTPLAKARLMRRGSAFNWMNTRQGLYRWSSAGEKQRAGSWWLDSWLLVGVLCSGTAVRPVQISKWKAGAEFSWPVRYRPSREPPSAFIPPLPRSPRSLSSAAHRGASRFVSLEEFSLKGSGKVKLDAAKAFLPLPYFASSLP